MGIAEVLKMKQSVKTKLMAAISMLLVSAILLSTSTYAWFVLSTAPEVKEIKTTAGANGFLEIALAGTDIVEGITVPGEPLAMTEGKSIAVRSEPISVLNTYWGNLLQIGNTYGLENMTIYPSRLNLSTSLDNTVNVDAPLIVPKFGTDGRITAMNRVQKASFDPDAGTYSLDTAYGVHLLGFFDGETQNEEENIERITRQNLVDNMVNYLESARESLRTNTIAVMEDHSKDLIRMMIELTFAAKPQQYGIFGVTTLSDASSAAIVDIVNRLWNVSDNALDCIRYAVMARLAADTTHFPDTDDGNRELAAIYARFSELSSDTMAAYAGEYGYTEITAAVTAISEVRNKLNLARNKVEIDHNPGEAVIYLFDVTKTTFGDQSGLNVLDAVEYMAQNAPHESTMKTYYYSGNPTVFPGMAVIAGDYHPVLQANMDYSEFKDEEKYADTETLYPTGTAYGDQPYAFIYDNMLVGVCAGNYTVDMYNTMGSSAAAYDEDTNKGALQTTLDILDAIPEVPGELVIVSQVNVHKTGYGYSLDLAFRSNEACALQLQQTGVNRVTGETKEEAELNGTYNEDLTGGGSTMSFEFSGDVANPTALMAGIYVVFMDTRDGTIYAVATVDQDNVVTVGRKVTAPLKLYTPSVSEGLLTTGSPTQTIRNLEANKTLFVTAIVYLNGDIVNSAMLSATGSTSLQGSLNLQFGTNAELEPIPYSGYLAPGSVY